MVAVGGTSGSVEDLRHEGVDEGDGQAVGDDGELVVIGGRFQSLLDVGAGLARQDMTCSGENVVVLRNLHGFDSHRVLEFLTLARA